MREIWKNIPGWPGYQASNYGAIRSVPRIVKYTGGSDRRLAGQALSIHLRKRDGYCCVDLCANGQRQCVKVHQLVAAAFKGPCPAGKEVRHKNGFRAMNNPGNLIYGTRANNEADKVRHGTSNRGERSGSSKLTRQQVIDIRSSNLSTAELAKQYLMSTKAIRDARSGRNWGWL